MLRALAQKLPSPDTLSDDHLRGRICVWCGTQLTAETAYLDFGQLTRPRRWFPRACRPCADVRADRARTGLEARK
ncbi:hypothetical protein G3I21_01030 [Streptomyces bauhiniae]|uniref:Uncharacterized protein n=1 Tax=Streptomyces bauhiniae TaxID=2340725 RepID=A0A7K3QKD4_9ACTN|nr:hypothetical protein [Streptomyces bauhiniae]